MAFLGSYERQLDPKGRVALPAEFRKDLDRCVLARGSGGCVDVFPPEEFEALVAQIRERVRRGELPMKEQRALTHKAFPAQVDGQGRVLVPEELRRYAGLEPGQKVMVAGNDDRIELWQPDTYAEMDAEVEATRRNAE